jgi:diaminohydroxyphosphoribosylaminopyrimidine deaminase/5-amino-6-(5-phosphoribosylamino)uracil reductase
MLVLGRAMTPAERTSFAGTGVEVLSLPLGNGQVDLRVLLQLLGQRGINSVLVEGGSVLFGSLFDAALVDKVIVFISPVIIGGREAKTAVAGNGVDKMSDACRLESIKIERYGEDLMLSGYIKEQQCSPVS